MLHLLQTLRLDRAFAGATAPALRAHLARCQGCQRRYLRHLVAEAALPDGDERAATRLWRDIQTAAATRPSARRWAWPVAVAAAASLLLVIGLRDRPTPRGGDGPAPPPALHLFRNVGGRAEPLADRVHAPDGLLFAYSNPGAGYSHLMVFALDPQGRIYWFYPAYQHPGDDPQAVPIASGRSGVELREEIQQPLHPGPLRLFALFLPGPERVLAVEAAVARAYRPGDSLDLERKVGPPLARQESWLLEVLP
jgi:hypothetical protein